MPARFALVAAVWVLAACSGATTPATPGAASVQAQAQVASSDHYLGAPQRVQIGVVSTDPAKGVQLLTSGSVEVTLTPAGGAGGTLIDGTATYVPAPGTSGTAADRATFTTPDVGRGVYQLETVFEVPGVWDVRISGAADGVPVEATTSLEVLEGPRLPAPGQRALPTENLTAEARDLEAVDSRAADGAPLPDPELHTDTIHDALRAGRPIVALFATPVYCQSQFCGPTTDALAELAATGDADTAYIHVEVWHDFDASEVNEAAADWLLRDGQLTEPWLFVIDADGVIVDRWSPLFDPAEVTAALGRI
jgi:hypothetical protein